MRSIEYHAKQRLPLFDRVLIFAFIASVFCAGLVIAADKAPMSKATKVADSAAIGKKAPDFVLKDLDAKEVRLSDFKGKIVVLEWFNPECPFIKRAHERTLSLKDKASSYAGKGVVFLAINSNGPGKQGHEKAANIAGKSAWGITYPILLDPDGSVGKQYGALRTPHMFIVDRSGKLVYSGAVDNTRGGDPEDADPPPAKNYLDEALTDLLKGRTPQTPQTEPWGCTVKYAN